MDSDLQEYVKYLDRATSLIPETKESTERFEVAKVNSVIEGRKTIIVNWKQLEGQMRRPSNHIMKFLAGELATAATYEGNRVVFNGRHQNSYLNQLLNRYIQTYVYCTECGKPDTNFFTSRRIQMIRCEACGATRSAPSL